jgi:hypothetical protein
MPERPANIGVCTPDGQVSPTSPRLTRNRETGISARVVPIPECEGPRNGFSEGAGNRAMWVRKHGRTAIVRHGANGA